MPNIATVNGIAEDNIATHNGGTAALYNGRNGHTWVHYSPLVATGGTITTGGNYKYHTFTSSANFTVTTLGHGTLTTCWLVGGGAGASHAGGSGSGAGGWDQYNTISVSSTGSYYVTVGAGGAAGTSGSLGGGHGGTTSIATLTYSGSYTMAAKGGASGASGGSTVYEALDTGASGGGAHIHGGAGDYPNCQPGTYSPYNGRRQGYDGGGTGGGSGAAYSSGGGGGASMVGYNARQSDAYGSGWSAMPNGSRGGDGKPINIGSGNVYYAGGGAGSTRNGNSAGVVTTGGNGGGGSAGGWQTTQAGTAGTTNRGGGAGGSYTGTSFAGGSGICIIAYQYQQ